MCTKKRHSSLVLCQVLVTVYAELYMAPGTHLSQPSAFWEKRWDGLVRGYENCTINYSCLVVPRLFLQAPENAGTALVLYHFYLQFVLYVLISAFSGELRTGST